MHTHLFLLLVKIRIISIKLVVKIFGFFSWERAALLALVCGV